MLSCISQQAQCRSDRKSISMHCRHYIRVIRPLELEEWGFDRGHGDVRNMIATYVNMYAGRGLAAL